MMNRSGSTSTRKSITLLPESQSARLYASLQVPDVVTTVAELVQNALDARARRITVALTQRGGGGGTGDLSFSVEDDGIGISPRDFDLLGKPGATSKFGGGGGAQPPAAACSSGGGGGSGSGIDHDQYFGFKGQALAALTRQAAKLEITSRAAGSFETWSKAFGDGGQSGGSATPNAAQRARGGTAVSVSGFAFGAPVRQRALLAEAESGALAQALSRRLALLMLCWPEVELAVTGLGLGGGSGDAGSSAISYNYQQQQQTLLHRRQGRALSSMQDLILWDVPADALVPVNAASSAGVSVEGCALAPEQACSTADQCVLYVGRRPVHSAQLQGLLGAWFAAAHARNARGEGTTLLARSVRRARPAYLLRVTVPPGGIDVASEPDKSSVVFADWPAVAGTVMDALVPVWGLPPSTIKAALRLGSGGAAADLAAAAAAAASASSGGTGGQINLSGSSSGLRGPPARGSGEYAAGRTAHAFEPFVSAGSCAAAGPQPAGALTHVASRTLSFKTAAAAAPPPPSIAAAAADVKIMPKPQEQQQQQQQQQSQALFSDTPCASDQDFLVLLDDACIDAEHAALAAAAAAPTAADTKPPSLPRVPAPAFPFSSAPLPASAPPPLLSAPASAPLSSGAPPRSSSSFAPTGGFAAAAPDKQPAGVGAAPCWRVGQFATAASAGTIAADAAIAEPAILSLEEIEHALGGGGGGGGGPCSVQQVVPGTVTRDMLHGAAAIGQVNCKAVAARCSGGSGGVVLAIDQHAADERVRLEALQAQVAHELGALRGASPPLVAASSTTSLLQTMALTPPRLLELSRSERVALSNNLPVVESWGWRVTSAAPPGSGSGEQHVLPALHMACMPCVCGVALGALDLRLYLHQLSETASSSRLPGGLVGPNGGGGSGSGNGSINLPTPPGVLRVLRSRACRTAIMFGDKLDASASVDLVASLGQTALPFVCAHGRPTTAPLVDLVALRAANVLPVFRAPVTAAAATAGKSCLTLTRLTALVKS